MRKQRRIRFFDTIENYINFAMSTIYIDMDVQGCYARVHSSETSNIYTVRIDESGDVPVATNCNCADSFYRKNYCKHVKVADLYYQKIYAHVAAHKASAMPEMLTSIGEVITAANEAIIAMMDNAAVAGDKTYKEALNAKNEAVYASLDYEALAATKKPTHGHGCCGHIVKLEHDGELCGSCFFK